jgi:hypothetical protein
MATAKKPTVKKSAPKKAKKAQLESFQVGNEPKPFNTFKITDQTVYWSILLILILILALWILQIQINTTDVINSTTGVM